MTDHSRPTSFRYQSTNLASSKPTPVEADTPGPISPYRHRRLAFPRPPLGTPIDFHPLSPPHQSFRLSYPACPTPSRDRLPVPRRVRGLPPASHLPTTYSEPNHPVPPFDYPPCPCPPAARLPSVRSVPRLSPPTTRPQPAQDSAPQPRRPASVSRSSPIHVDEPNLSRNRLPTQLQLRPDPGAPDYPVRARPHHVPTHRPMPSP